MVPDAKQQDEAADHEFGSFCFEELEPEKVLATVSTEVIEMQTVNSEDAKHLLKSQRSPEVDGIVITHEKELEENQMQAGNSEFSESSENHGYQLK